MILLYEQCEKVSRLYTICTTYVRIECFGNINYKIFATCDLSSVTTFFEKDRYRVLEAKEIAAGGYLR